MIAHGDLLLVDDEPNVLAGLALHLRRDGHAVRTATSGSEAIAMLEAQPADLVIADEQMPRMSGSELVSRIRRQWPQTVCIMLSGQASVRSILRALNQGEVLRYLVKPCRPIDLLLQVRLGLLQGRLLRDVRKHADSYRGELADVQRLFDDAPDLAEVPRDAEDRIILDGAPDLERRSMGDWMDDLDGEHPGLMPKRPDDPGQAV